MLKLRDIMTTDVVTVSPELSLRDCIELLSSRHVSGAPVVAGASVVGVISASDLLSFAAATPGVPTQRPDDSEGEDWDGIGLGSDDELNEPALAFFAEMWEDAGAEVGGRFDAVEGPEWDVLSEHTVQEAMTRMVQALPADTDVAAAAEQMGRGRIHRLLVTEGERLLGIVSSMDIVRAVAERRLTTPV
jgi:CBS domain-containing protein